MKQITLEINGEEKTAFVQKLKKELWVHMDGKTFTYSPEVKGSKGQQQVVVDPSLIVAPMPGKIIKVMGQVGQELEEGQTVIVMEAMKMEYTLKAAANVKVEKINCSEGQQVSLGETLAELEVLNG